MSATLSPLASSATQPGASTMGSRPLTYLYNGTIHTMNPATPSARHMLLAGSLVWHCDDAPAPLGLDYQNTGFAATRRQLHNDINFIDLEGRTVLPGLVDSHVHFLWWALNLSLADLSPSRSEDHALRILREHCGTVPKGEWIVGFGWSHNLWEESGLPSRSSLDALFPDNPVYLSSKCGHVAWVNSAALAAAQIDDFTRDPAGGEIERANGAPTGILKETANALVHERIAATTEDQKLRALERGQYLAHSLGITGMHTPEDLDTWGFLQRAHEKQALSMRVNFWIPVAALDNLEALQLRHGLGDDRLRISAVKLFSDGSLGGRTALMHQPYTNEPTNYGICVCEPEEIRRATLKANRCGLAMAIHAIGDKAVENVLKAYEAAQDDLRELNTCPPIPNRIEHLQVFDPAILPRLAKVRPIASMQPIHLCADMGPADSYWGERSKYAYAFKTLQENGCTLAFGSDAPVESINPFYGLYAAISRRNMEGSPAEGWHAHEKITLHNALEAYTVNPAIASGQSSRLGSLAPGKRADFIILPSDPYELSPEELRDLKPDATFSGGVKVYEAENHT